jgi:hypothetical protein
MGQKRNAYEIVVDKAEAMTAVGKPRLRYEDNIKIGHAEIVCEGLDWSYVPTRYGVWTVGLYMVMTFGFLKKADIFFSS